MKIGRRAAALRIDFERKFPARAKPVTAAIPHSGNSSPLIGPLHPSHRGPPVLKRSLVTGCAFPPPAVQLFTFFSARPPTTTSTTTPSCTLVMLLDANRNKALSGERGVSGEGPCCCVVMGQFRGKLGLHRRVEEAAWPNPGGVTHCRFREIIGPGTLSRRRNSPNTSHQASRAERIACENLPSVDASTEEYQATHTAIQTAQENCFEPGQASLAQKLPRKWEQDVIVLRQLVADSAVVELLLEAPSNRRLQSSNPDQNRTCRIQQQPSTP
ncbi:hypothetical protein CIHG_03051 [Coccidioides immitis H538.4]|uniref:Uncharacterized protein n=2 Tax=Coccidioides immitis TaxID=5501 RepID=A0A0J8RKC7_COCIT|nr:hypothetical protein CIRG_00745 [Coccidioides immitis RMSCC 2394]KMU85267.1 hypothetical protein CIHG_03051 [Coccidioides immitis H538.4]